MIFPLREVIYPSGVEVKSGIFTYNTPLLVYNTPSFSLKKGGVVLKTRSDEREVIRWLCRRGDHWSATPTIQNAKCKIQNSAFKLKKAARVRSRSVHFAFATDEVLVPVGHLRRRSVTLYLFYYGCLASYTSSVCSASTFPSR